MNDNNNIKIVLPSRNLNTNKKVKISLESILDNKIKLWRRKLSRKHAINTNHTADNDNNDDDDNDVDDIMPTGSSMGLANKYNITFSNVSDLQYISSNINTIITTNSTSLLVLELSRCGIVNDNMIDVISTCTSLRYLNLESNLLTNVPMCLSNLQELEYLNLKRNQIGAIAGENQGYNDKPFISKEVKDVISRLKILSQKLLYLNMSHNPISTIQQQVYRTMILKTIPSLIALDHYMFSDNEHFIIKSYNITLDTDHTACHYSLHLSQKMISIPSQFYDCLATINTTLKKIIIPITEVSNDYHMALNNMLNRRNKLMKNIRLYTSPICKKQRLLRRWIVSRRYHVLKKILPKLQASIRRKLLLWRINNEMLSILKQENLGHLLISENIGLTPEEIRLRVSMGTIKKFLRNSLIKMRRHKCAIKIQRKFRTTMNVKRAHSAWLEKNKVEGILVTVDCLYGAIAELEDLFRRRNTGHDINTYKFEDIAMKELTEAVKEHKAIESIATFKSLDYDETYRKEPINNLKLHYSTSYHKLKRKNITKTIYQPFSKHENIVSNNSLFNKRSSSMVKITGTYKILQHLKRYNEYAKMYYTIIPRGNIISDNEQQDIAFVLANNKYRYRYHSLFIDCIIIIPRYYETAKPLTRLVFNDIRVLCDLGLTLRSKNIRYTYDSIAYRDAAAIIIQRAFRGLIVRAGYAKKFIQKLLRRRAVLAMQRWWRQINSLIRRLKFHSHITSCCRSLSSNVVYLDAWTFFTALKADRLPSICNELKLFPEFRGVPAVDDSGTCSFKYLHRDYMGFMEFKLEKENEQISESKVDLSVSDSSQFNQIDKDIDDMKEDNQYPAVSQTFASLFENSTVYYNAKDRARFGLPKWPFWSPKGPKGNEVPKVINSRSEEKYTLFDIITKGVSIAAKIITPNFADDLRRHLEESVSTDVLGLHVIELKFRNIQEARERCAMLMIASYDYRTRQSIVMCNADDMVKKINNRVTDIAKALFLTNKSININNNNYDFYDDVEFEIGGSYDPNKSRIGSHITPIEIKVQFNCCPRWVYEYEYTIRDLVRFRFMCESLRQYSHQRRLVDKIKDNELNSFYDKHKFEANDIVKNPTALIASTECSNHIEQSIEASQTSFNTNNQDSHLDKRFALDWDGGDFPSLYANTQSLFSAVQVDPGLPAPIIPTDSIGHIEPKDFEMLFDQPLAKVRPNTSPKLLSQYKSVPNDDSIGRILLWCSRDNEFDALKGGFDEKKLNLFSLAPNVILGSTDQSSTVRLETIILAEYYSYVQKCNSKSGYRQKPGSASSIIRQGKKSEDVVDVIYKEYDDNHLTQSPQILYNVRRVFGCKELNTDNNDNKPSPPFDWKEKLAQSKYEAAERRRREKEDLAKRQNVMNAFEDCAKQDLVRNVIKSRGESREKIAKKLSERDKNILSREAKSRESKSREASSASRESSREGNKDNVAPSDMTAFHDRQKQQLRYNVLAHKQQKQIKQAERLFCQNLQKSFNSLIKKTVTQSKSNKYQQHRRNANVNQQELQLGSINDSEDQNDLDQNDLDHSDVKESIVPASLSLASEMGSYRFGSPDILVPSNIKQVRVSFSDLSTDEIALKMNGFNEMVSKAAASRRKESPSTSTKSRRPSFGSFTVTLPSITTTSYTAFTDATLLTTDTIPPIIDPSLNYDKLPSI